ncbi:MAG: DsbA family oxidoreductase [Sphingomonadales bacterium]|nr:DsbA family oxidoreductase [Sphingomonadales bacterium]
MSAPVKVSIDIWSDVMCPWCAIGYSQLRKGLAQLDGEIEAEIRWLPFELNPDMVPEGEDWRDHVRRKYGRSPEESGANRARLVEAGDRAGYDFRWHGEGEEPPTRIWNTFAAHKLLKWTLIEHGAAAQTRLKLALFNAHFQQRRDMSDPDVLADVAASTGLDRDAARRAIDDDALAAIVREEERMAWDMNITGVPAMVVQGKFLIPGAQEPETYVNALRRVVAREGINESEA